MNYCNYRDVTSVYSLNSWKLPGRFFYGLGTRLVKCVTHKLEFTRVSSDVKTVANGHFVNQIEQRAAKSMQAKLSVQ